MKPKVILIWGGGLAGSFLAVRLLQAGQRVLLVDNPVPSASSRVAAGLYNVITGRLGAKTWMAETLTKNLAEFFRDPDYQHLKSFLHPQPIYRPFKEIAEFNKWTGRAESPDYQEWVTFQESPILPEYIHNDLGGIWIKGCGWLDSGAFLEALQEQMKVHPDFQLLPVELAYENLNTEIKTLTVSGDSYAFDQLVFCEGFCAWQNPFFPEVKIIPNKGELLRLQIPNLTQEFVFSRKVYVIPLGSGEFIAGSTYEKRVTTPEPSIGGKESIEEMLGKLLKVPYTVVGHMAGVRPTTPNRRPILGTHPQFSWMHLFNGLGTKGVLQAPYFSKKMTKLILGKEVDLPPEASLTRFYP